MKKQYKCIKTYPVAQENDIVEFHEGTYPQYFNVQNGKRYTREEIVNYPDYWEEVIELCVPIGTKFKHRRGNQIYFISKLEDNIVTVSWFKNRCNTLSYHVKNVNNWFKEGTWIEYKEPEYEILTWYFGDMNITKDPDGTAREYFIHSIKRTSDGEIFTIGDRVKCKNTQNTQIITQFEIDLDSIRFRFNNGCGALLKYFPKPSDIQKVKKPLFITEDLIQIYGGEECYSVDEELNISKFIANSSQVYNKYFAMEANAEEYIKLNKPMFSYMDILNGYKACINFNSLHGDVVESKTFIEYLKNTTNERYKG